jgi:O-antigen/teichoic acid export membrane protein
MVLFFLSISSVGVYSVATKISGLFTLVITLSVISAYTPQLLNRYKVENVKEVESYSRKRSYMVIVIGLIFTALCWLLLKTAFLRFVGEGYEGAFEPAIILLFSQFMLLALQMRGVFLLYKKKFKTQTLGLILSLTVNICLNVLLVPRYSITGAAVATSIAYVFSFLFIEYHCLKSLKTDY